MRNPIKRAWTFVTGVVILTGPDPWIGVLAASAGLGLLTCIGLQDHKAKPTPDQAGIYAGIVVHIGYEYDLLTTATTEVEIKDTKLEVAHITLCGPLPPKLFEVGDVILQTRSGIGGYCAVLVDPTIVGAFK